MQKLHLTFSSLTSLWFVLIVLCTAVLMLLAVLPASAEPASTDPVKAHCMAKLSEKVRSACQVDSNIEHLRNTASYHCQDRPVDNNEKATCIQNAAIALFDKTLRENPHPSSASDFTKDLTRVLTADAQAHNGSINTPSPDSTASQTPTTYCGAADCPVPVPDPALCAAKPSTSGCTDDPNAVCTKNGCDLVKKYVNPAITLLSIIFGLIAALSLIMGGIQYTASAGDPQKASLAKKRISMTIIAFITYAFLYAFIQFLVPGGAFK